MKPIRALITRSVMATMILIGLACAAGAQPLPTRSFKRLGTTQLRHGSRILCLAYSPDGEMLAAGGGNDPFRLWNPKTGALVREFNEPWVHAVAFTTSGDNMVYGGYQKTVRVWSFKLGKETGKLEGHKAAVKAVAIAPDTSIIASGSQDGTILLWDWFTKAKLGDGLKGHLDEVTALVYTPDSSLLISGGSDRVIHLWDTTKNTSRHKLDAGCAVHALAVSADGKTLYSAGDDHLIRRWDIATGKPTGVFKGHDGIVVSLVVQGDSLISGSLDRTVRFWDAKTTEQKRSLPRAQGDCDALAVTKAGDFVAVAGLNNVIRIFDAASGKEVAFETGPHAGLASLQLSPDKKRLASVTAAGTIHVWDLATGKLVRDWDTQQTGELVLAYAPGSNTLVTAADTVRFWNADTGKEIANLPTKGIVSLAFSPDGKTIALAGRGGHIELWDWENRKLTNTLRYIGSLYAVAWSPDGKLIAGGGGSKIFLWDAATGNVNRSFDVKEGPPAVFPLVASLAFDADGRKLAAGCFDAMIRIYQLHEKNPTAERVMHVCDGHLSMPYAIAFSPDGRTLVTGSFDKTVRLWEAFSGKQIAQFKGHIGSVMGVAFAADGRSVWSAGSDAVIYQWDVPGIANNGTLPDAAMTPQELENAWTVLALEDTPRGHEMMWRCTAFAKQAIPNIGKKLYTVDPERVKKLFKDLDSNHYATRLGAMGELAGYGRWMEGRYEAAMANPPSLEYKRRVETLKEKLNAKDSPSLTQERLRVRRFMVMCEQVGGPEAMDALRKLADRGPEEEVREEAKGSLLRLSRSR